MNCVSHQPDQTESGPSQVVVSIIASDTVSLADSLENATINEAAFQEDISRRAEVITDLLAGIMEQPTPYRHWGLNE